MCHYELSCRYRLTKSVNTYAWMSATPSSRVMSRIIMIMVIVEEDR